MSELRDPSELPLFAGSNTVAATLRAATALTPEPTAPVLDEPSVPESTVATGGRRRKAYSSSEVDWQLITQLRGLVSERLAKSLGEQRAVLSSQEQQQVGRRIIGQVLDEQAEDDVTGGRASWTAAEQERMAQALFDAVFGLGRLQPLVSNDAVENVIITGHSNVWVQLESGETLPAPPVADSDAELIDHLVFLASRSEVNARPFSEAQPRLHMKLDDGSRLAAAAWVTPRPQVVIRRHRIKEVTLDQLVELHMLTPVAASFLDAAIRARKSVVVAGPQGAGKTTLVRALCQSIDPEEAIGTFETEYELMLHEMPERHHVVHAWEARPGSGEIGADGRQAGEFTVDEALYDSFRFNLSRQIVGEVRGKEVLAMIKAMSSGSGSISTTHANSAAATIGKLVTCALEAGQHVTVDYATRAIAESIDFVVQLHLRRQQTGRPERWVSEIVAVEPGEAARGYALTPVFKPAPNGPAIPGTLPEHLRSLESYGFQLGTYLAESSTP